MFGAVNMHFQCFSGGAHAETDVANKARTGNVLGLHMIFHDRLMLGHILAFGAAVQAVAVVPVHQGLDLRVQLRRGPRDYEIRVI